MLSIGIEKNDSIDRCLEVTDVRLIERVVSEYQCRYLYRHLNTLLACDFSGQLLVGESSANIFWSRCMLIYRLFSWVNDQLGTQ
jgi:hypothetical protein